ncbi:MAG: hypothetical protein KF784_00910 [Fimbriimonadaceae bacterium]|nr:hypothetical protein [Fimbriimonadaceae bacterium]
MKRPSKKEIKAAVEKLKEKPVDTSGASEPTNVGKPASKKTSQRIRKQGV